MLTSNTRRHIDNRHRGQLTRRDATSLQGRQIKSSARKRRRSGRPDRTAPDCSTRRQSYNIVRGLSVASHRRHASKRRRRRRRRRGRREEIRWVVAAAGGDGFSPERRSGVMNQGNRAAVAQLPRRRDHHRGERVNGRGDVGRRRGRRRGGRNRVGLTRIGPVGRGEEAYMANLGIDDRARSPARIHGGGQGRNDWIWEV